MFVFKRSLFFCFLFWCFCAEGQIKFSASLNPSVISRDDHTTIRFLLENVNDVQNISPPSFKDFILISGPMQESGMTTINGIGSNYLAISFILKTKGPGKYRIPPATAIIGGKKFVSNSVNLVVKSSRSSIPQNTIPSVHDPFEQRSLNSFTDYIFKVGEDVTEKVNKNMHLRLEVNKASCFVGEPLIASYKLYTRLKSESKLTQNPSFNGFSVIDLQAPDVTASSIEKLNGREYNVYTIRKAQLYPLQDGRIDLETAELENKIQFIRESYAKDNAAAFSNLFNEFATASVPPEAVIDQTVFLRNKPVSIVVKPLPIKGKPADYKGAVGDFVIESGLENNTFSLDKSGKLIVMISGNGNLQLVTPPVISWPPGIEGFEPKTSDILSLTSVPVSGKKVFEYSFSADTTGDYTLPGVGFSYFDPNKQVYKTVNTGKIDFTVIKDKEEPVLVSVPPVKESGSVSGLKKNKWLLIFIASILLLVMFYFIRKNRRIVQVKTDLFTAAKKTLHIHALAEASSQNQQNPLALSEKCLYDPECLEFYTLLMTDIKNFIAGKYFLPGEEINNKLIAEKMDKMNVSNETVLSFQQLLHDIEWQLYTPFERNEKMEILYKRSHEILMLINTYTNK